MDQITPNNLIYLEKLPTLTVGKKGKGLNNFVNRQCFRSYQNSFVLVIRFLRGSLKYNPSQCHIVRLHIMK